MFYFKRKDKMKIIYLKNVPKFHAPIAGMKREIRRCNECKTIFAYYYIPFGINEGYTVGACICTCTSWFGENNVSIVKKRRHKN